jgi:hypothetical protein
MRYLTAAFITALWTLPAVAQIPTPPTASNEPVQTIPQQVVDEYIEKLAAPTTPEEKKQQEVEIRRLRQLATLKPEQYPQPQGNRGATLQGLGDVPRMESLFIENAPPPRLQGERKESAFILKGSTINSAATVLQYYDSALKKLRWQVNSAASSPNTYTKEGNSLEIAAMRMGITTTVYFKYTPAVE